jgi:hypothetical protein
MQEEESPGLKVPKSATNFNIMNKGLYKLDRSSISPSRANDDHQ